MEIPFDDVLKEQPSLRILKAYYKINKVIGKGAFGVVYKAFELCSGRIVAIKQIKIDTNNKNLVAKEIDVLKKVEHPNIVEYFNFLKEDNYIFIIMEFLEGGTLKQYIQENSENITEDIAREIIKQIFNALSYLHYSVDVCHRDIKPENIMFSEKNNISSLKLLDFGLSSDSFESKLRLQNCGTLTYMAPEQISGAIYSKAVDVWSVGIILYMLLNKGKNAFYEKGDNSKIIIDKINNKEIKFDLENCPISPIARHLIMKLLDKNPSYRYSARLALNHPWITGNKNDKIPMTLYDKLLVDENSVKLKMMFLVSSFLSYYKNNFLKKKRFHKYKLCRSEKCVNAQIKNRIKKFQNYDNERFHLKNSQKENNNTNDSVSVIFNMDDYEKEIKKTNELLKEKFRENREKMFSNYTVDNDKILFFLKTDRIKLKLDKKEKMNNISNNSNIISNNIFKDKILKLDIAKEMNNENFEKNSEIEKGNNLNNSRLRFSSINIQHKLPYKALMKKTSNNNQSPINVKSFNDNTQSLKEQGKTPDININNKKYGKKLSAKLISFRLSLENKGRKDKYIIMQNGKNKIEKPIKLQSLKNNNNNGLLNKNKNGIDAFNSNNKELIFNNNHNIFETIKNKVKLNKNGEKLKKYSSMEKMERNINGIANLKISGSVEAKKNLDIENTEKKKMIFKSEKLRDEYKDIDNTINIPLFTAKPKQISQTKIVKTSLTSIKKGRSKRSNSIDNHRLIQPKKLFNNNNNYILPPIRK